MNRPAVIEAGSGWSQPHLHSTARPAPHPRAQPIDVTVLRSSVAPPAPPMPAVAPPPVAPSVRAAPRDRRGAPRSTAVVVVAQPPPRHVHSQPRFDQPQPRYDQPQPRFDQPQPRCVQPRPTGVVVAEPQPRLATPRTTALATTTLAPGALATPALRPAAQPGPPEQPQQRFTPRLPDADRWGLQPEQFLLAAPQPTYRPPAGPPPRTARSRRPWIAALVLLVVAGLAFTSYELLSGDGPSRSPAAVVSAYLHALSTGDASTALAQGSGLPDSDTFLTDDALSQQQRIARISSIHIGPTDTHGSHADVEAHYTFGAKTVDTSFGLSRHDGQWRLRQTTVALGVSALAALPDPTLFGQPISTAQVYVFPGPLVWGSVESNSFMIVDASPASYATSPAGSNVAATQLSAKLGPAGRAALAAAIKGYIQKCAESTKAIPAPSSHCPQSLPDKAYDGSARWSAPSTLSGVSISRGVETGQTTMISVRGSLTWVCSYHPVVGKDGARGPLKKVSVRSSVHGTIDFSAGTPVLVPQS